MHIQIRAYNLHEGAQTLHAALLSFFTPQNVKDIFPVNKYRVSLSFLRTVYYLLFCKSRTYLNHSHID